MRNMEIVDAVITLHEIARLVESEIGKGNLSDDLRNCADRLHLLSIQDSKNSVTATDIINKAKE